MFTSSPQEADSASTSDNNNLLVTIPRDQHSISRNDIDTNALKVLYRLHKHGYQAYLVGGGVRDLLLGLAPKDFDIATNATPEQVKRLFRNCRVVGRRFKLAHILFGREIIEVATLRGHHEGNDSKVSKANTEGRILRDNVYGDINTDAERRDFTVNALYYDISDFSLKAYPGSIEDLNSKKLRMIGDTASRYREDPVRMLRAVRFAVKLGMRISQKTRAPITELAPLLADIPAARLFDEITKLFFHGHAAETFVLLRRFKLFAPLFPILEAQFSQSPNHSSFKLTQLVMAATDERIQAGKPVTSAFFYAAILWYSVVERAEEISSESGLSINDAYVAAMGDVLAKQCRSIAIPRRHTAIIRDIWQLQLRLERGRNPRAFKLFELPKFRAGYDLLLLRAQIEGKRTQDNAKWWTEFVDGDDNARSRLVKQSKKPAARKPRRRKPKAKE